MMLGSCRFVARVRCGALPDHGIERVREEAVRAAVEAADVAEVPSLFEVALDEAHVALKKHDWESTAEQDVKH